MPPTRTEALIIGAGFGGVYQLYLLRKLGLDVMVLEAGGDLGGIWYWNAYPGARVDSDIPVYEYSIDGIWKDWSWSEKFPGRNELRDYFSYVDSKLDIKKHVQFNAKVVSAEFDTSTDLWTVTVENGNVFLTRFLVCCTGFAAKHYIPDFKGLDTFKGICYHTAHWPQEGFSLKGKRVGVIGTGASGVQLIQECAPEVSQLTVFQRTPNFALPMVQSTLTEDSQLQAKSLENYYDENYRHRLTTFGGLHFDLIPQKGCEVPDDERNATFEQLWSRGGFNFWLGNYYDLFSDQTTNDYLYAFWRDNVRMRINDPTRQEILAPMKAPHPFGTKRPCLEQRYYEVYNQSNVDIVNLQENPIVKITEKGVLTQNGVEHEFDVLVLATGFDAVTGGLTQINIKGTDGRFIAEKWGSRLRTYLGLTVANFPNMFFLYGPHGPTAFCNGPTCIEVQAQWIANCLDYLHKNELTHIQPTQAAEEKWSKYVDNIFSTQLFSKARSWYTGANIPGKTVQSLNFTGGLPTYIKNINEVAGNDYEGFLLGKLEKPQASVQRGL